MSTAPWPRFAGVTDLDIVRVRSPGLGLWRRLFDPGGEALVFDEGGSRYLCGEIKNQRFEYNSGIGV